jgi:hypothetical protein
VSILTLDEAKQQLNIAAGTTTYDEELTAYVDATVDAVAGYVGPIDATSVTQVVRQRVGVLTLDRLPVLSLTAVTDAETGTTVDTTGWVVDPASGVVQAYGTYIPARTLRVTYLSGRDTAAAGVSLAARVIVQHLWQTQRGPSARTRSAPEDVSAVPGFAFAVPNRAIQLLERYRSLPGMA